MIALEGPDGSGKGTQAELLVESLNSKGISTLLMSFPSYEDGFFGGEIKRFLKGEFGSLESVHPKLISVLYAADRFEKSQQIRSFLELGHWVVCDRYYASNLVHQGIRSDDPLGFELWLERMEFGIFGIPKPDLTVVLDVDPRITLKLLRARGERDIMESDRQHLRRAHQAYLDLALKNRWTVLDCSPGGVLESPGGISAKLLEIALKAGKADSAGTPK